MIIRREAFKALSAVTGKDDTRYSLSKIQIRPDGSIAATDGYIALVATDKNPMSDTDFPSAGIPPNHGNPDTAVLLSVDVATRLVAATPKGERHSIPVLAGIQVAKNSDGSTYAAATDLTVPMAARIDHDKTEQFPNVDSLMPPASRKTRTVILAGNVLAKLVKAAAAISRPGLSTRRGAVRFEIPISKECYSRNHVDECARSQAGADMNTECTCDGTGNLETAIKVTINGEDIEITGIVAPCRE